MLHNSSTVSRKPFFRDLWAFGAIFAAWCFLFWPYLSGQYFLPFDSSDSFYAITAFIAKGFRTGDWPWWNPYIFSGYPQIADPQSMMFSPGLILAMMLPNEPSLWWFDVCVLGHLLAGAYGFARLLQNSTLGYLPAFLGALVFMSGGVAASRLQHTVIVLSCCYFPWVTLCLYQLLDQPSKRRGLLFAVIASVFVLHTVQVTYLLCWILGVMTAFVIWSKRTAGAMFWKKMAQTIGCIVLASAALLAVPAAAIHTLVAASNRPSLPLEAAKFSSFSFPVLMTLLSPNYFQSLSGSYSGPCDVTETLLYVGILPTILVLIGLLALLLRRTPRRITKVMRAAAALGVISLLYAMGVNTIFYMLWHRYVPGIRMFRRPSDAAYLLNLSLACASACGLELIAKGPDSANGHRGRNWSIILLPICSTALFFIMPIGKKYKTLGIGITLLVSGLKPRMPRQTIALVVLATTLLDLRTINIANTTNAGGDAHTPFMHSSALAFLRQESAAVDFRWQPRFYRDIDVPAPWDNGPSVARVEGIGGYNPLLYQPWLSVAGGSTVIGEPRSSTPYNTHPLDIVSQLSGVRYLVSNRPYEDMTQVFGQKVQLNKVQKMTDPQVYRVAGAFERILCPVNANIVDHERTVPVSEFRATDFEKTVWLTAKDQDEMQALQQLARNDLAPATVIAAFRRNSSLRVDIAPSSKPSWLVVNDLWYPGWEALVDGRPVPIYRANLVFRAVYLPSHAKSLVMSFTPWSILKTAMASGG